MTLTRLDPIQPDIQSERCVHARSPAASCSMCVDVCPQRAWILDEESLSLDQNACDGCGLCRPACPELAIEAPFEPALRAAKNGDLVTFLLCGRAIRQAGEGTVPCLHALGLRDLLGLSARGLSQIVIAPESCDGCTCPDANRLDRTVDALNAIRGSRNLPDVTLSPVTPEEWRARLHAFARRPEEPDAAKRRLLGFLRETLENGAGMRFEPDRNTTSPGEVGVFPAVPRIDAANCTGCNACAGICPHGAITLRGQPDQLRYDIDAGQCTGCRLCMDVCDEDAVTVTEIAEQMQHSVPLKRQTCRSCGVPFHTPAGSNRTGPLCEICTRTSSRPRLYQVYD